MAQHYWLELSDCFPGTAIVMAKDFQKKRTEIQSLKRSKPNQDYELSPQKGEEMSGSEISANADMTKSPDKKRAKAAAKPRPGRK